MKLIRGLGWAIVLGLALVQPAAAGILNGDFTTGTFAGWTTAGDALVATSAIGVAPPAGTYQAFLTTASQNGDMNSFSGTDAASAAALETFLGLPAGALAPGFEGSALQQTFTAAAGDTLSFRTLFLTTEGQQNDFAVVTLSGPPATLADTNSPRSPSAVVLDPIFGSLTQETAWLTWTHTFAAAGTYTLGLAVLDAGDEFNPSGLLIANVALGPRQQEDPSVPEPATLGLLTLGLLTLGLLAAARARRRMIAPLLRSSL